MNVLGDIRAVFSLWIDVIARSVSAPLADAKPVRRIEVGEEAEGTFLIRQAAGTRGGDGGELAPCRLELSKAEPGSSLSPQWIAAIRGGAVDVMLQPSRFVFRPLELPSRATEFLRGIIQAQIDRLTPWNASEVLFHWTQPQDVAGERTRMTVVAIGRAASASLAQAFSDLGAARVEISTVTPEGDRVTVFTQQAASSGYSGRLRPALIAGLATTGMAGVLSSAVGGFIVDSYDAQQQQVERRIAEQRAIMRSSQIGSGSSPLEQLIRRKQTTPSSVIVIEALSALLPGHTYATELRIEGDKLQITGLSRDAPSLIQLLEQSPHFSSAGFFAPTTRAANEPGERFHIEAKLKPHFELGT